jgi:hypothetical protein
VDLFSQLGIVGLIFFWFSVQVIRLGWRLHIVLPKALQPACECDVSGLGRSLVVMLCGLDSPFVYNIGFPGFQASVLVWLFLGGLISLDHMTSRELAVEEANATGD